MPDIVLFNPNVQKTPVLKQDAVSPEETAAYRAGAALKDMGDTLLKIEDREQTAQAREDAAKIQASMSEWIKTRAADGDVGNLAADVSARIDTELANATSKNRSAFYRMALENEKPALLSSFLNQAANAKINGTFFENEKRAKSIIDAKNTFVLNNPDQFKTAAEQTAQAINDAVLPAAAKEELINRAGRGYAYISMQHNLQEDPVRLRDDILNGEYAAYMTAEEQMNYLSGAENKILDSLISEPQNARDFIAQKPDYFKTIKKETVLKKIDNAERSAAEAALQADRLSRAVQELDFWREPTQAKIDAFDFRGNAERKAKWEDALSAVPKAAAQTDFSALTDFDEEIKKIAAMPDESDEQEAAVVSASAEVLAKMLSANQAGRLEDKDFDKHRDALIKAAQDKTIRADFRKAMPSLEKISQAQRQVREIADFQERRSANRSVAKSRKNLLGIQMGFYPAPAQRILADGFANMLVAAANGQPDAANEIYQKAISDALNVTFPAFAGKKKGDIVDLGDGVFGEFAGMNGIIPVVKGN